MKKLNFVKIFSLAFACVLLMSALAIAGFSQEATTVEIVSNNVYYGDTYQIMYAINAPEGAEISATDSKGNAVEVVPFAQAPTVTVNGVECKAYITKQGVSAQALDEVITLTVSANGVTATRAYSVLAYLFERMYVKNNVEGAELAMFEALLTYANAADLFFNGSENNTLISDLKYVSVVGGTLDGVADRGMFAQNSTPFANLTCNLTVGATQFVRWYVSVNGAEAVVMDLDDIKALAITGNVTTVTAVVMDLCSDGHTWLDATCKAPKTCDVCGATEGELGTHADKNDDFKCDACSTVIEPADGDALTLSQAITLGKCFTKDKYTTNKFYITGVITEVTNTTFGNVYIKDESGKTFLVYGLYSMDGSTRYDALSYKPVPGDEITVYGVIGYYTEAQMKNAWIDEVIAHTHNYSEATCTDPAACTLCGLVNGTALGHTEANDEGLCDRCGTNLNAAQPVDLKLDFSSKNNRTAYSTSQQVWEQNGVKLINDKSASTTNVGDYYNPARFYASSKITIECAGMTKIVFNCNSSSYATALKTSIGTVSGATVTVSGSVVTVTFEQPTDSFVIAKLSAQVRVNNIVVTALQ